MRTKKIELVIEKAKDGQYWGRSEYKGHLITTNDEDANNLENLVLEVLADEHGLKPEQVVFDKQYDITALLNEVKYLNISSLAKEAGISPSLLRQYIIGIKTPSIERAKLIQDTLHKLGRRLQKLQLTVSK